MNPENLPHRLICQNIMGTPAMAVKKVRHDMRVLKAHEPTVFGLQEFKFRWYWAALLFYFPPTRWGKYPMGFIGPRSSQPIIWDRKRYKKIKSRRILLHKGKAANPHGWEDRYITAVLLEDRLTGFRFWVTNRHYLPAAWKPAARGTLREIVWHAANNRDADFIEFLVKDGYPVFAVGDYNWPGSVYPIAIQGHQTNYHGWTKPIDKVISWNGDEVHIEEVRTSIIPGDELFTDHGGKVLVFLLQGKA